MKNEIVLAGKLIEIIEASRNNALRKVNEELIRMYWSVGEYLSAESKNVVFGDKYIDTIAKEIQVMFPGIKGFNRRGLYRMNQFYELYKDNPTVSPLVTQISWTNHCSLCLDVNRMRNENFISNCALKSPIPKEN